MYQHFKRQNLLYCIVPVHSFLGVRRSQVYSIHFCIYFVFGLAIFMKEQIAGTFDVSSTDLFQ